MLPSASLGDARTAHGRFGLYEPIHGSAPDIAGQDIANPIGHDPVGGDDAPLVARPRRTPPTAIEAAVSDGARRRLPDRATWPSGGRRATGCVVVGTTGDVATAVDRARLEAARDRAGRPTLAAR